MGKEVGHPLIPRTWVKSKVESSLPQVLVSSLAYGSLGSLDFVPQSPLRLSRHTRSRQKTLRDPIKRERRARPLSFSLLFSH